MNKDVLMIALGIGLVVSSVNATVVIDPSTGWTGDFSWHDGIGQIDAIQGGHDIDWSISVAENSILNIIQAYDSRHYVPGDEYELILDGSPVAWPYTSFGASGFFSGEFKNLVLSAGTHLITINITALAGHDTEYGTIEEGTARASFSGITPINVPEPTTVALLCVSLLGLAGVKLRRQ